VIKYLIIALLTCVMVSALAGAATCDRVAVSPDEAKAWLMWTIPLPKEIQIPAKVVLDRKDIGIVAPADAPPVVGQACKELRDIIGIATNQPDAKFKITMQIGGPGSEPLTKLENSDQAYLIAPESGDVGLRLVALTPEGMYYAAKTLQQLIDGAATPQAISMPLVTVRDWPDMSDRGLWGADSSNEYPWLAGRKMNIVEQISARGVDKDGKGWSKHKANNEKMSTEGNLYAVRSVPAVLHLEQITNPTIYEAYPQLKPANGSRSMCYSRPEATKVIADFICSLMELPNIYGVDVWMAENMHRQPGCECEECKKVDRSVLEARTIVAAWREAEKRLGRKIPLYILSSEETAHANTQILEELPSEVKFWYYDWVTYYTGGRPMIRKNLEEAAAKGKWIGVVPNIDSITHLAQPFTGADFIYFRMMEFHNKGLKGLLGYSTPMTRYNQFLLEGAAEWAWNAKGRTVQEFTAAYAVRQRFKDPAKWTEWANLIGPVEWDIYGSDWPHGELRGFPGKAAEMVKTATLPKLGNILWDIFESPWGEIKTEEQLNKDVADAAKALLIAREMGIPEFWYESVVCDNYMKSLKALYELKRLVKKDGIAAEDRSEAGRQFQIYMDSLKQAMEALPKWEMAVMPRVARQKDLGVTGNPVNLITQMRKEMAETAKGFGYEVRM
jgi:hypothetical protein